MGEFKLSTFAHCVFLRLPSAANNSSRGQIVPQFAFSSGSELTHLFDVIPDISGVSQNLNHINDGEIPFTIRLIQN
jgi:hypothetical protein